MATFKCTELFPTKTSFIIFILYMALFINQGLLVTWSQNSHHGYNYNTTAAVLLTEVVKLIMTFTLFTTNLHKLFEDKRASSGHEQTPSVFFEELIKHKRMFGYYMIPAVLYCLYNNLSYTNLSTFDPTTYFLLLQFRVVVTGVVFQILFDKKLSCLQWTSLLLLTLGCMVKEMNFSTGSGSDESKKSEKGFEVVGLLLILVQVIASSSAGVYNEYIFKKRENASVNLLIQNTCLYLDSILCNAFAIILLGKEIGLDAFVQILTNPIVLVLVLNNSAIGIVTSFFLSQLNSILKTYASALELMFTAVLCYIFFSIEIGLNTVAAIAIVTGATFLYAVSPVVNQGHHPSPMEAELKKMIDEDETV